MENMDTNGNTWTSEDVQLVEKFIEIKNRGLYCDGTQLTTVYNRVLHKKANVTGCGSCLRARVCELETALNQFKRKIELEKKEEEPKKETKKVKK